MLKRKPTAAECAAFLRDPSKNPVTGRALGARSPIRARLVRECAAEPLDRDPGREPEPVRAKSWGAPPTAPVPKWSEAEMLAHRAKYKTVGTWDALCAWLAAALDHNDLCWSHYFGDLGGLGDDSTGGTNGAVMADIVRGTRLLTMQSQDSLVAWDATPPVQAYLDQKGLAYRAEDVRTRSFQRAFVQLYGDVGTIKHMLAWLHESGIVGDSDATPVRALVEVPSLPVTQIMRDDGRLAPYDEDFFVVTWEDFYSRDGAMLIQSTASVGLEGRAPGGVVQQTGHTAFGGGPAEELDGFMRSFQKHDNGEYPSCTAGAQLRAQLARMQPRLGLLTLVDVNPMQRPMGGLCVWLARTYGRSL